MSGKDGNIPDGDRWSFLFKFFDGSKNEPPDIAELAKLLRGDEPLPHWFRSALAEFLDSRWHGVSACNWRLKPVYIGRNSKAQKWIDAQHKVLAGLLDAERRGLSFNKALPGIAKDAGICERDVSNVKKFPYIRAMLKIHSIPEQREPGGELWAFDKAIRKVIQDIARRRARE